MRESRMTAKIERGDRDGGVRGLDASSAAGRIGPRSCRKPRGRRHEDPCSKQRGRSGSGVVKTPAPSVMPRDDLGSSRGVPGRESDSREPGTYGRTGNRFRSGGRSRSDASRVFRAGRSQGLVEREGASLEEARSTADAGHGWREGETVRGSTHVAQKVRCVLPTCG